MEHLGIIILSMCIVFVIQLFRVALYLKRVNNISKPLTEVLYVLLNAPFHRDLNHPNTLSKIRVSCAYYLGIAVGHQYVRSRIKYSNNQRIK